MPLRDHFHSRVDGHHWEWLYGGWPAMIVQALFRQLPERYCAGPRVHLGRTTPSDLPSEVAYEVRVFDAERGRRVVAAVEIVSPANKNRPENRRALVARCAALLWERVSVTIVDPV